jgi:hypothetical protein
MPQKDIPRLLTPPEDKKVVKNKDFQKKTRHILAFSDQLSGFLLDHEQRWYV